MHIETVTAQTFERVLPLIAGYQRFYKAEPDETRNRAHFGRLLDDRDAGIQFVALDEAGQALGFATLYFPLGSVTPGVACLMNDLFVVPEARGQGTGRGAGRHHRRGFGYGAAWSLRHRDRRCRDAGRHRDRPSAVGEPARTLERDTVVSVDADDAAEVAGGDRRVDAVGELVVADVGDAHQPTPTARRLAYGHGWLRAGT